MQIMVSSQESFKKLEGGLILSCSKIWVFISPTKPELIGLDTELLYYFIITTKSAVHLHLHIQ
jgi:hypothetical protein